MDDVGFSIDFDNEENGWSDDICNLLSNYEYNCSTLANSYKGSYLHLMEISKLFKIPLIFLSSANSIVSVGLSAYLDQPMVSNITCLISFICGLISSIELYLGIQKKIESQIISYRSFYLLSIKINNLMRLHPSNRNCDPMTFLTEIEEEYKELFINSNILVRKMKDKLLTLDKKPTLNKLLSFRSP
jgi:hypothetical protein